MQHQVSLLSESVMMIWYSSSYTGDSVLSCPAGEEERVAAVVPGPGGFGPGLGPARP